MRTVLANLQVRAGQGFIGATGANAHGLKVLELPVTRVQAYTVDTALDTDSDQFTLDIGDPRVEYSALLDRDSEILVNLFTWSGKKLEALHSGIVDEVDFDSDDRVMALVGRDYSSIATDTDAAPGRFYHVKPKEFIESRARALGINSIQIHAMSEIGTLISDGTEKEWQLWYRIVREKDFWLWFEPTGQLTCDRLNYSATPTYHFGKSLEGTNPDSWLPIEKIRVTKSTRGRKGEVWVYFQDAKTKKTLFGLGKDTSIESWKRRPISIITMTTAKDQDDIDKRAGDEIHDSIVSANEVEVTIADPGFLVRQNYMAELNIPDLDFQGLWFVVGVRYIGGPEGYTQVVRLREAGFALDTVVPEPPVIKPDPARKKITSTIVTGLVNQGVRWAAYFVEAANDYGVKAGWELATFLGVLLSICSVESGFQNIRQNHPNALKNGVEWFEQPDGSANSIADLTIAGLHAETLTLDEQVRLWQELFANEARNPKNPFSPHEAGVGPMQLTTLDYKEWADGFGWNDHSRAGEYDGGRWNPRSNIKAAARALAGKLLDVHADPNKPDTIWDGVRAYNGAGSAAEAYRDKVHQAFTSKYEQLAMDIIAGATTQPAGTRTQVTLPDGTVIGDIPADTPDIIKKAISFAIGQLGKPYEWGASGPDTFDCSGLTWAAYNAAGYKWNREDTFHQWANLNLVGVARDQLLPGDLVFFNNQDHEGMIIDLTNQFIHAPHTGDVVKISSITDPWYSSHYDGARRVISWNEIAVGPQPHAGKRQRVLIQAGHADPKEPGFPQEGASGEKAFTIAVRDHLIALLQQDDRFSATSAPGDIPDDWVGEMALYLHADGNANPAVTGYSFGYGSAQDQQASLKLRAAIVAHWNLIPNHPDPNPAGDNYTSDEAGYYGFHRTSATAELLMEHGFRSNAGEALWMDSHVTDIAKCHYSAICDYFGFQPTGL